MLSLRFSLINIDKAFNPPNLPLTARLGFTVFFCVGAGFAILAMGFDFIAKSMRQPGISWWQAQSVFGFSVYYPLSHFYTDGGIRIVRKGRKCYLVWLLLWAIAVAIIWFGR